MGMFPAFSPLTHSPLAQSPLSQVKKIIRSLFLWLTWSSHNHLLIDIPTLKSWCSVTWHNVEIDFHSLFSSALPLLLLALPVPIVPLVVELVSRGVDLGDRRQTSWGQQAAGAAAKVHIINCIYNYMHYRLLHATTTTITFGRIVYNYDSAKVRLATAPCHVDLRGRLRGLVVISGAFLAAPLATGWEHLT